MLTDADACRKTDTKWNIVASPQEFIDCSNGCDGGWPLSLYESIAGMLTHADACLHMLTYADGCDGGWPLTGYLWMTRVYSWMT